MTEEEEDREDIRAYDVAMASGDEVIPFEQAIAEIEQSRKMTRFGWQEISNRFSHIDARFVSCEIGLPDHDGFFTVELYPWWEHPLYLAARDAGENWGFANINEGRREVTVYPKNVRQFRISRQEEVTDWDFTQEHPILWLYEESGTITCNSPLTLEHWMEISSLVTDQLTDYNHEAEVAAYAIDQVHKWGHTHSFSLGSFPYSLFEPICRVLDSQGIRYFAPSPPKQRKMPVAFIIDNDDYIIADDFEIDVPEFIHKSEWFQPR